MNSLLSAAFTKIMIIYLQVPLMINCQSWTQDILGPSANRTLQHSFPTLVFHFQIMFTYIVHECHNFSTMS